MRSGTKNFTLSQEHVPRHHRPQALPALRKLRDRRAHVFHIDDQTGTVVLLLDTAPQCQRSAVERRQSVPDRGDHPRVVGVGRERRPRR